MLHSNGSSPLCIRLWSARSEACVNLLLHTLHQMVSDQCRCACVCVCSEMTILSKSLSTQTAFKWSSMYTTMTGETTTIYISLTIYTTFIRQLTSMKSIVVFQSPSWTKPLVTNITHPLLLGLPLPSDRILPVSASAITLASLAATAKLETGLRGMLDNNKELNVTDVRCTIVTYVAVSTHSTVWIVCWSN